MADRTVGSLPRAADLYDDSLLEIEQQGAAASLEGRQLKRFARKAVEDMEVSAHDLPTGSPASVEKTAKDGRVLLSFGLPAGARGLPGAPGSSIQKIERTGGSGGNRRYLHHQ